MKIYRIAFFLFALVIGYSCSDNSIVDTELESITTLRTPKEPECVPEDIPCPEKGEILADLIGPAEDEEDLGGVTAFGYRSTGILDRLLNCGKPLSTDPNCNRKCPSIKLNSFLVDSVFISIPYTGCQDFDDVVYSAEEQQEVINQVINFAHIYAPLCDGVPMMPVHYDLFVPLTTSGNYNFQVEIVYVSECDKDVSLVTGG